MPGVKGQKSGGANRKSADLHLLQGTWRADRHGATENIPDPPPVGRPEPRKPLTGEALAEWDRTIVDLEGANALALIDAGRLYQYVHLFAEVEAIHSSAETTRILIGKARTALDQLEGPELIQAMEQVVKLQQLAVRQVNQLRQGRMALRQYLNDFGMTPVARHGKVPKSADKPKSSVDRFRAGA